MSLKWTGNRSESGILRKSEFKEKKEELFVFGYSCKLFRDNERALHIDQGKHLIPWMGDETLKIDRYDARGALHDLTSLEAPPGGYDWRVELTKAEWDVEQLCDEERYRALHTDEDEEEMYKEEELKRLHAAGYGQVGFNYDLPQEAAPAAQTVEIDEPFLPSPGFKTLFADDILMPDSQKHNAIIEKTAKFIASQGAQMEILIKAKQGDNVQFQFLNKDNVLNPYYAALISLVKAGKWPEKTVEVVPEKPPEQEEYLHPSLASTIIESAPSIPSIHYKPSADCDYTMLISKMRGETVDETFAPPLAPGEVAPPGTEPLPPRPTAEISKPPVMYNRGEPVQDNVVAAPAAYYQQFVAAPAPPPPVPAIPQPAPGASLNTVSTGLSLMRNYNTDSESEQSEDEETSSKESNAPTMAVPPADVQVVIDKMAAYVARNGDDFADIVRAKNDPRFTFLEPNHVYHPYYKRLMQQKRGIDVNGGVRDGNVQTTAPVSFSIKKMKEPDPILPKPALPYESSSEEESETQEKVEEPKEKPVQTPAAPVIPPVVMYKIEQPLAPEPVREIAKPEVKTIPIVKEVTKVEEPQLQMPVVETRSKSPTPDDKRKEPEWPRAAKPKQQEKRRESRSETEVRESKKPDRREEEKRKQREERETIDRERKERERNEREKRDREKREREKRRQKAKEEMETEIISLVDNPAELIDLTDDHPEVTGAPPEGERALQVSRRRRAAEFLRRVGVDPAAASLPASSLASAMVDTLETLRKKKAEEEEKRRKRDKRRHRDRYDYENGSSHRKSKRRKYKSSDDNEEHDIEGKKKKRKKDKKHSSKSKKKKRREADPEEDMDLPLNIDLTSTLKELRNSSPTKELVQEMDEGTQINFSQESSADERERDLHKEHRKKREEREYSEGEWSSDSEQDSVSSASRPED